MGKNKFIYKLKYLPIKIKEFSLGFVGRFSNKKSFNYCIENNAGDRFNKEFIKNCFGWNISKYTYGEREHYLFCGSLIERSNSHSIIVGAGSISGNNLDNFEFYKIIGLRGKLTLKLLENSGCTDKPEFLGDPGLLMMDLVNPIKELNTKGKIGIVPHFMDKEKVESLIKNSNDFIVIDIKQSATNVCEQIKNCRVILSSSLHGLIFSDAMNVPNCWVTFGGALKGGQFKFLDYYSCMDNKVSDWVVCDNVKHLHLATSLAKVSKNNDINNMRTIIHRNFQSPFIK